MPRELPNSQMMEQSLLGALLIYPNVMSDCLDYDLQADEFYLPGHQRIFQCMKEITDKGEPLDLYTLTTRLTAKEEMDAAGGTDYIIGLADFAISSANTKTYIEAIKNYAQLRNLIFTAEKITGDAYESSQDIDDILDSAERAIMDVTRQRRGADFESSQVIVARVFEQLKELRNQKGVTGIQTGYRDLDNITNGFQRGDLIIIAARPSMGKSAFALNVATEVARRNPGAVAVFSLEMPADQLMKRLMSAESHVESDKLRSGRLSDTEMSRLYEAGTRLSERKIYIDDTSAIKVSQIFSKCRKLKMEHGNLSLVVIDYLQLITGGRQESRQQEVSDISRNLKILAKELDCPVIALSQLSRRVEERSDHEPQLADLRESGSIEQDADIVMFLHRKDYYLKADEDEKKSDTSVVDVIISKHRNGSTGSIKLAFEKSLSHFINFASQYGEDIHEG